MEINGRVYIIVAWHST